MTLARRRSHEPVVYSGVYTCTCVRAFERDTPDCHNVPQIIIRWCMWSDVRSCRCICACCFVHCACASTIGPRSKLDCSAMRSAHHDSKHTCFRTSMPEGPGVKVATAASIPLDRLLNLRCVAKSPKFSHGRLLRKSDCPPSKVLRKWYSIILGVPNALLLRIPDPSGVWPLPVSRAGRPRQDAGREGEACRPGSALAPLRPGPPINSWRQFCCCQLLCSGALLIAGTSDPLDSRQTLLPRLDWLAEAG